jgi:Putative zinc-finger
MMHVSDQDLLRALDGELTPRDGARVGAHLAECWTCRARKQEIESAIADFVRLPKPPLPSAEGPRALLRAQLAQVREDRPQTWRLAAAICALLIAGLAIGQFWSHGRRVVVAVPNPRLTPGATVLLSSGEVCRASNTKNKTVPVALRQKVFEAYGIAHAEPRAYEVDYLITPALGGAEDIHNLWPQSYSDTVWNAQVKDDLEDHLRALVCAGELDLATAQREIAMNWIEAYKKYFHTDRPR